MKKPLQLLVILAVGVILFLPSCRDGVFDEVETAAEELILLEDSLQQAAQRRADSIQAVRDSLAALGGIIDFSINLVNANGSGYLGGRTEGDPALNGSVVSISQHGTVLTQTTDESGIATFRNLRIGTVSISVANPSMTDIDANVYFDVVNYENSTTLYSDGENGIDTLVVVDSSGYIRRKAAIMFPLFSTTTDVATVSGVVSLETDLTDSIPETTEGVTVTAVIDFDDPDFRETYFREVEFYRDSAACEDCKQLAKLVNIAWNDATFSTTTDSTGAYTLNVPATANGLPIDLEVSEFATEQTILVNNYDGNPVLGPVSIRTIFGTGFTSPSSIPSVPGAYAIIDDPTGSAANPPDDVATATASLSQSGIAAISIVQGGFGYTQAPKLTISDPGDPLGTTAEATALLTDGRVTGVEITEAGSGYTIGDPITITPSSFVEVQATATPFIEYSVIGFTNTTPGAGYISEPTVTINSGEGSGASARAILDGTVTEVEVDNIGGNYVLPPEINFVGEATNEAEGTAVMTEFNPIHSIEVTDIFTDTYEVAPTVRIDQVSTGSGAEAVAVLATDEGFVNRITLDDGGTGYVQAPSVLIEGGGGQGAQAQAIINNGVVVEIEILSEGRNFTSTPNVILSAPPAGGTQATATAILGYELDRILVTDPGSGYDIDFTASGGDPYSDEPTVNLIDQFDAVRVMADNEVIVRPAASVEEITVDDGGSGYESTPSVLIIPIGGVGSGAAATASVEFTINELEVIDGGSGYELSSDITVTVSCMQCTTTAEFTADLGDGVLSSIELTEGGRGYTAPPNVVLNYTGPGVDNTEDVEISSVVSDGAVTGFTITNAGGMLTAGNLTSDYSLTITDKLVAASFSANVFENAGQVISVTITDPGSGYVTAPIVQFDNNGTGGEGASATAVVENGRIVNIVLTNPGNGYVRTPNVSLVLPTFTKTATASLSITDGHVTSITLTDGGAGYVELPNITIMPILPGYGSGATGVIADISGGVLQDTDPNDIYITNQGSGYTANNFGAGNPIAPVTIGGAPMSFDVISDKSYVRDVYLGTGVRTEQATIN